MQLFVFVIAGVCIECSGFSARVFMSMFGLAVVVLLLIYWAAQSSDPNTQV
jgi:hypothetical protein